MKKSLLALAVLGAFASAAQAQSSVTIGGIISANVKDYSVGNSLRPTSNEIRVDDDYTSRFWLTGTEDLGGGNAAIFYIENRFNTDVNNVQGVANGLGNGDTFVGLKGSWGQLTAGKHTMMYTQGLLTEMGGNGIDSAPSSAWATFSILSEVNGAYMTVSRVDNSLLYTSPNLSGFSGRIGYSASAAGNEGNLNCTGSGLQAIVTSSAALNPATCGGGGTASSTAGVGSNYSSGNAWFLQGNYSNGPIYLNLAYWATNAEGRISANGDQREARFSGSYAIPGGFKVGLQVDRSRLSNSATGTDVGTRTAWEIPASYTFGPNTILASYTRANDLSTAANTGAKMWTLGYDYALSKRTNVGVWYTKLSNDSAGTYSPFLAGTSATGSALAAGESASTFALGIKHTF